MGAQKLWYARPGKGGRSLMFAVAAAVAMYAVVLVMLLLIEVVLLELLRGALGTGLDRSNWLGVGLLGMAWVGVGWKVFRLMRELVFGLRTCIRENPADEPVAATADEPV